MTYLEMKIEFVFKDGSFKIDGNVKKEQWSNIIENFLYKQVGQGIDTKKAIEREVYHFTLRWYPSNDNIVCLHDTGNLGLRDGILRSILQRLE